MSINSPVTRSQSRGSERTQHARPQCAGAIAGLDPREAVAWSLNRGGSWDWGREVGVWGSTFIPGDYAGSLTSDDGTRLPWYAWQETGEAGLRSNQPYMSYPDGSSGQYTLRVKSSPRATVLTEAGGYAPVGKSIGGVTVRNTRTGQTGRTASARHGTRVRGSDQPVSIAVGDTYEVTNTGFVWKAQGDNFLLNMGIVGPAATRTETVGQNNDRAELFAAPDVYDMPAAADTPAAASSSC